MDGVQTITVGEEFHIRRGDILLVDLRGAEGGEKMGCRPALVLQNNVGNDNADTTIVAPITSQYNPDDLYPFEVELNPEESDLETDSVVQLNQIRTITIDDRVEDIFGWVDDDKMNEIDSALRYTLGLKSE